MPGQRDTGAPPAAQRSFRPEVLSLWSPAVMQFALLTAAVLTVGLFAGNWLFDVSNAGTRWLARVRECWFAAMEQGGSAPVGQPILAACTAQVQRERALLAFAGLAVAGLGAAIALAAVPPIIERRRELRPLPEKLAPAAARLAELAHQQRISRTPDLMVGTSRLRDAFSYGLPSRYRIALPPKLAVSFRRPAVLDSVLAHELAHVGRHDVTHAWLARTVWYVILPILAVPMMASAVQGDLSIAWEVSWRIALLLVVVRLVTAALLRVRENEADLVAARQVGEEAVQAGLRAVPPRPTSRPGNRTLALHPSATQRAAIVADPAPLAQPGLIDGLTAGFLAGLCAPLLLAPLIALWSGSARVDLAYLVTAVLVGGGLGAYVGVASWRAALVGRLAPGTTRRWRLAVGVGLGLVLGDLGSIERTGTTGLPGSTVPQQLLALGLVGAGATAVVESFAELWADGAAQRSHPPRWQPVAMGAGVLATGLLALLLLRPLAGAGLGDVGAALSLYPLATLVVLATVGLGITATALIRRGRRAGTTPAEAPGWLIESGRSPWPTEPAPAPAVLAAGGLLVGLLGAASIVTYRVLAGPAAAGQATTRFMLYLALGAFAAAALTLVLSLARPRAGPAAGLIAGPVAGITVAIASLLLNAALGGSVTGTFVVEALRVTLTLGLLFSYVAAAASLLRPPRRPG